MEKSMRALVVDDSRAIREIIGNMLKELGYQVFEAGHGKDALKQLSTNGAMELAMVDWNMPEMNGYEFVCAARGDKSYDAMRIVMVTTETEISQTVKALEAGANEYIMKPFTKDIVKEKLALLGLASIS